LLGFWSVLELQHLPSEAKPFLASNSTIRQISMLFSKLFLKAPKIAIGQLLH
jgi:hypothetical protein